MDKNVNKILLEIAIQNYRAQKIYLLESTEIGNKYLVEKLLMEDKDVASIIKTVWDFITKYGYSVPRNMVAKLYRKYSLYLNKDIAENIKHFQDVIKQAKKNIELAKTELYLSKEKVDKLRKIGYKYNLVLNDKKVFKKYEAKLKKKGYDDKTIKKMIEQRKEKIKQRINNVNKDLNELNKEYKQKQESVKRLETQINRYEKAYIPEQEKMAMKRKRNIIVGIVIILIISAIVYYGIKKYKEYLAKKEKENSGEIEDLQKEV